MIFKIELNKKATLFYKSTSLSFFLANFTKMVDSFERSVSSIKNSLEI